MLNFLYLVEKSCAFQCSDVYQPVCGSDRKTHSSTCTMLFRACTTKTKIFKIHDGPCGIYAYFIFLFFLLISLERKKKDFNNYYIHIIIFIIILHYLYAYTYLYACTYLYI